MIHPSEPADTADSLRDAFMRRRQFLRDERPVRIIAITVAYGMGMIYLPTWLLVCVAWVTLVCEVFAHRVMGDPDRLVAEPARRHLLVALVFVFETAFATPPVVIWHLDDPYARALAIGLLCGSMMHMATVRAIHLPQGLAGAAALTLMVMASNVIYWTRLGDWQALAVTSLCATVTIAYFIAAMISNNRLHHDNAVRGRLAQRADAAKGRFLSRMSHELRTPLNGILGIASAELRAAHDPAVRERLAVLVASAEGLATILDDSLDAEAVADGRLPIRLRPTVPRTALTVAAALFRHRIEEAGLRLVLDLGPGLDRPALMDEHRVRQCLSNLLSNALRHTAEGSITIRARRLAPQELVVEVADTGCGIDAAVRDRLFAALPNATSARKVGHPEGHGLGLSIARDLARQMGGDLVLLPDLPGATGARFRLTVALPPADDRQAAPVPHLEAPRTLAGLSVLVVDDLATNRLVAMTSLRLLGAKAFEAASGAEALCRLAQSPVDAVLLDINMPDMDGVQTLREIRALPLNGTRVVVVAMTADAMPQDRQRFLAEGMDGYLAKPVTPERIAEALHDALAPRVARRPESARPALSAKTETNSD